MTSTPTIVKKLQDSAAQLMQPGLPYEIEQRNFDGIDYRTFKNTANTVKDLLDTGRAHGEVSFIVYEDENYSFNDFFAQVDAIGYQLAKRYGIIKGDRVAIAMRNYPEWMMVYVAVVSLGAIVVPLNSWGKKAELEYGVTDSGARVVFCDEQRYLHIADSLAELNTKAIVTRTKLKSLTEGAELYSDFITDGLGKTLPAFDCSPEDPVMIMYTSGTTGLPKGALSNHRNIIQALTSFEFHANSSAMANLDIIQKMLGSGLQPTALLAVPLFHVSGCYALFLLSLLGGRRLVMMYKWDAGKALALIERERITTLSAVPSMVIDVLEHPDFEKTDTSCLSAIGGGGTACPPKFSRLVYEKVESAYLGSGYGMTETNAICATATGAAFKYKPTSSGTLSPIVEFKTVDEDGKDLPNGAVGEIWIKSPTVIKEYWKKPEASADTFRNGWVITGDIGYLDDENFVFIVDRAKDMVIRGGENIASAEIESCVLEMPQIHEVAAFGVPHESLGEELGVAITFQSGASCSADDVRSHVKDNLAGFKVPSYVWVYEQVLPRGASGKVLKKQIQQEYLAKHG
ncbi:MAG: long-chain acyl-CoA synthetase [Bermanella sp.]|jgi:long-chain acyl-CoA synthetase